MIIAQDSGGRLDVAVVRVGELLFKRAIEPRLPFPMWDRGVGEFVRAFVTERLKVPSTPYTVVDVARGLGILPRQAKQRGGAG